MIYGKLTVHDRQTDEVHVEITRKGLSHARPNYTPNHCPSYHGYVTGFTSRSGIHSEQTGTDRNTSLFHGREWYTA